MPVNYGSLPFLEAIAFFRAKLNLPTQRWDDLLGAAHDRAFVVAGAMQADLLADLREAVDKAIADGTTIETFRKDFKAIVAQRGWTGWTGQGTKAGEAWRTRVIYDTNLFTSYSAGRFQQMKEVAVSRPYWRYRHSPASTDPRKEHLAWDGLILKHDDPWFTAHTPPNGFGCKCYIETLAERDMKKQGLTVTDKGQIPFPDSGVDKGWDYQPGASVAADLARLEKMKAEKVAKLSETISPIPMPPPKPQFQPKATVKEAEKYVIDNDLADFADYGKVDISIANECNRSLFEHIRDFPELRKNQEFIGSAQAQCKREYDLAVNRIFARLRAVNPLTVTDKELMDEAKKRWTRTKVNANTLAWSWDKKGVNGVAVNERYGSDLAKTNEILDRLVKIKFHPEGTASIKASIDHEFAHQLDALLALSKNSEIVSEYKSLKKAKKIKEEVSEYAEDKIGEFIAEAWSEYRNNPTPRQVSAKIGDIIIKSYQAFINSNP